MATCPTCQARFGDEHTTCPSDGTTLVPDAIFVAANRDLEPGQLVGEYQVEAKIGEGGFGAVYRAVHPLIGKAAAIKVLHRQYSSNPQMVSRFMTEARAVNQIKNRNIVDIFSFGALDDGRHYYVMELLAGRPLDAYLAERGRLPPAEALPLLRPIARALDAAHAAGIVHRDLKPENVMLAVDDEGGFLPKLLDFGIAKLTHDPAASHKTRTGVPIGTPHYMSPEQCRGKGIDHRTDIYSFGVLTYQMLTGRRPFDGGDMMDILTQHTSADPTPMSLVCPALSPDLDAPVQQMLAKDPADRPASVGEALEALATAAGVANVSSLVPAVRTSRRSGAVNGEAAALTQAKTLTFQGAQSDAPSRRKRWRLVGGLAAASALLFGAWVARFAPWPGALAGRDPREEEGRAGAVSVTEAGSAPAPPESAFRAASAPPTDPGTGGLVELFVFSTPGQANIFLGDERLGQAPGPVFLPRGGGKVKLVAKHEGFRPTEFEVSTAAAGSAHVKLPRAPPRPPNRPVHRDLEAFPLPPWPVRRSGRGEECAGRAYGLCLRCSRLRGARLAGAKPCPI